MFGCLATLTHGLRVLVEALLYCLYHILMLPSRDPTLLAGGAAILERAMAARIRPIAPQLLPVLLVRVAVAQPFARRAAVHILIAEIDEVLLPEPAFGLRTRCHRLGERHGDTGLVAREDFLAAEVAAIRNSFEFVDAENLLRL